MPSLGAILEHYGIAYVDQHGWQSTLCPVHQEQIPSFRVNVDEGGFQCMACGVSGGDAAALVMLVERCSFPEAAKLVEEWTGVLHKGRAGSPRRTRPGRRGYIPRYRRRSIE